MSKLMFLTIDSHDEVAIVASSITAVSNVGGETFVFIIGDSKPFKVREDFDYVSEKLKELIK